ncbi:hypothetical protein [Streptomyces sp. CC228A]|uniref:hypothetical protein n=1 Tax=Streptomyces sp. CC228A TaxID=2898186 RepID=UPI001F28F6E7|nr:hypothetical protein [Streptomyces sp. CC228A]
MAGTSRRRKTAASFVTFALIGSGLHFVYATGFFGHGELCGDLISSQSVADVLPHRGKLSSDGADATGPSFSMDCRISRTSALPWLADQELHVYASVDRADFPFTHNGSTYSGTTTFFSGESSGAVTGEHRAWTWLPPACSDRDLVRVVATVTSEHSADRDALAKLTVETPNRLMDQAGSDESARTRGFATYAVVQDPTFVAGMKKSDAFSEKSPIDGRQVSGFDDLHIVADCGGVETYFAMEVGPQLTRTWESPGSPGSSDLFASFVSAVGKEYGCTGRAG